MKTCRNGHTDERFKNGICKSCRREQNARAQARRRRNFSLANLPLQPLRDLIRQRALEHAEEMGGGGGVGYKALTRRLAPRLGMSPGTVDRTLQRLLKPGVKYVKWSTADAWCCAMGVHISSIYTAAELDGEWEWTEEDTKKAPRPRCACGRVILAKDWDKCHVCRDQDMQFRCKHCGRGAISDHGLFLHSLQVHGDKSQGRHSWHSNKAVAR